MLLRSDMPAIKTRFPLRITVDTLKFLAGRHGKVAARPVAPRSFVKPCAWESRDLHSQHVMGRVDARAAVEDGSVTGAEGRVLRPELVRRLEAPAGVEVGGEWRAQRARDVAGLWIDRLLLAAVALSGPCVDQRHVSQPRHRLEVEDARAVGLGRREIARGGVRNRGLERSSPRRKAAVQDGLV